MGIEDAFKNKNGDYCKQHCPSCDNVDCENNPDFQEENLVNLCDTCVYELPVCFPDKVKFGNELPGGDPSDDRYVECSKYERKQHLGRPT